MSKTKLTKSADKIVKIVLFIFSPFVAYLYSLKNIKLKSSYVVFFFVSILFGLSLTVDINSNDDITYYYNFFEQNKDISFETFRFRTKEYFTFDSNIKDVFLDTSVFLVSRFTHNYHLYFAFIAAIFSFFYLKSLKFLTKENKFDSTLSSYLLFFLFTIGATIYSASSVRFWTASWIAIYLVFQIFIIDNKKYLFFLVALPLIHRSYWFFIGIILIATLFKKFNRFWIALFFISFFLSRFAFDLLYMVQDQLPYVIQKMVTSYASLQYVQEIASQSESYSLAAKLLIFFNDFYLNFLVFLFILEKKIILANNKTRNLFMFLLVYMAIVNFMMNIPSLGSRYLRLAYPIIAYIWLISFKDLKYKWVLFLMPIALFYRTYRVGLLIKATIGGYFYVSNLFYLIYHNLFV